MSVLCLASCADAHDAADYNVYQYYATSMTGYRVATTGSTDRLMDCYAVVGSNVVRILVGGRQATGETNQISTTTFAPLFLSMPR